MSSDTSSFPEGEPFGWDPQHSDVKDWQRDKTAMVESVTPKEKLFLDQWQKKGKGWPPSFGCFDHPSGRMPLNDVQRAFMLDIVEATEKEFKRHMESSRARSLIRLQVSHTLRRSHCGSQIAEV